MMSEQFYLSENKTDPYPNISIRIFVSGDNLKKKNVFWNKQINNFFNSCLFLYLILHYEE